MGDEENPKEKSDRNKAKRNAIYRKAKRAITNMLEELKLDTLKGKFIRKEVSIDEIMDMKDSDMEK